MSSPNTRAKGTSSSRFPAYLTGDGVDSHAIEFGPVLKKMAILFRDDAEASLCYQSSTSLASHTWVNKNLSHSFPSSEVRNSAVKWPHGRLVDAVGDYHRRKNQEKLAKPFIIFPATINHNCLFSNYLKKFSTEKDRDQQHMLFLLYWLNKFIFPDISSTILLEYRHLAEALHNHTDVWLQVYFPELRFPDIVLPEDQVMAHLLMSTEALLRRTYPWFQPGYRLFEKEPKEEEERIEFRNKFLSVMLPRDMPFGGGKPPDYHLGAEVYHPNFCTRQLGCPQLIPLKLQPCYLLEGFRRFRPRFQGFSASSTALKVIFDGWDSWAVYTGAEAKNFMVQMIKDINAQVIEGIFSIQPLSFDIGSQTVHSGEVIVNSVIATGDLELSFGDEEDQHESLVEQLAVEATPSTRRKRKEVAPIHGSTIQPEPSGKILTFCPTL
ncbi:unnamed protein product [Prunus armeniaca]